MQFPSVIFPVLDAFGYSRQLTAFKADEDAARQGHNIFIAALTHLGQVYALLQQVEKLEKVSGIIYSSFISRTIICLSTPLVAVLPIVIRSKEGQRKSIPSLLKISANWLYNHLGSICQLASVVTNIALFRFGYRAYAITSLSILTLGYLERRNKLPLKIRALYLRVCPWIGNIGLLLSHDRVSQLFASVNLFGCIYDKIFSKALIPYENTKAVSCLNYSQLEQLFSEEVSLIVNREHVEIAPFPIVKKQTDYSCILAFSENFQWDDPQVFSQLELSLEQDARWFGSSYYQQMSEQENGLDSESVKNLKISYAKQNFATLVYNVKNECIPTGEPLHYGVIKNYLWYIEQQLSFSSYEQQTSILLQLAVEGGDYCGPGIYYQLEAAATMLLYNQELSEIDDNEDRPRLPLKQRILIILQQERLKIVSAFHLLISKINPAVNLLAGGEKDVHAMNHTIRFLDSNFGLPDQGAQFDQTAAVNYIEKFYLQKILKIHSDDLWQGGYFNTLNNGQEYCQGYDEERVLQTIQEQIGSKLIPRTDIYEWALEWIENQSIDNVTDEQKEAFIEQLQAGETFESNLKFHDELIQAMLVDMGILSICS